MKPGGGVQLRNSLVLNLAPLESASCDGWIESTGSAEQSGVTLLDLAALKAHWLDPSDMAVHRVKVGGGPAGAAQWAPGDPVLDFDGTPIPGEAPSYAGADQP